MKKEIERKYKIDDKKAFLLLMDSMEIKFSETKEQYDCIFMRNGKNFSDLNSGEPIIRTRVSNSKTTTTLKKYINGTLERVEIECDIGDQNIFNAYLREIGFIELVNVFKRRSEADAFGVKLLLDHVEGLGDFLEIEIVVDINDSSESAKAAIFDAAAKIGLDKSDPVSVPYDEMLYTIKNGKKNE